MKKLVFLFAMVFAVSMVMAQNNDAFVKQIDNGGTMPSINVSQLGSGNLITGPAAVVDALGNAQMAALQNAGGPGWNPAADGNKFAFGQFGDNNKGFIKQVSDERNNYLWWCQKGDNNLMKVDQHAKHVNVSNQGQQIGNDNKFVGLSGAAYSCDYAENTSMTIDDTKYATQKGKWGKTAITFLQKGDDNLVGLYQNGSHTVVFDLEQIGDENTYVGYQLGESPNLIDVTQHGAGKLCKSFQRDAAGVSGNNFVAVQL